MEKTEIVLVTGATGLIGTHLVQRLQTLDRYTIRPFEGNILNIGEIMKATEGVDLVFHCAGLISYLKKDKQKLFNVNVRGTHNVMQAAQEQRVKRVVHLSSVSAVNPFHDYGKSKRESEEVCREFLRKGLGVIIVRPVKIYGAGDTHGNSLYPFKKIFSSRVMFALPGSSSYLHVDDLTDGLLKAMEHGCMGSAYIFAGEHIAYKDLYILIAEEMKRPVKIFVLPRILKSFLKMLSAFSKYHSGVIEASFQDQHFESDSAQKELHWQPRKTIREAVRGMIVYYRKHGMLKN